MMLGIAGMTWNPYILPVRALGKCGGYDSDIIAGIQWAAGMTVTGVPDNPVSRRHHQLESRRHRAAAPPTIKPCCRRSSAPWEYWWSRPPATRTARWMHPAIVPGVLAVAGLRNVGTKVGYSSFGAQVGISAPAGNCVNSTGDCLRSIDTTTNTGLTTPGTSTYTNEQNPNLGTSFSAPIVSAIAALMRSVNANLTPAQLIARIESSSTPFPPNTGDLPVCPASRPNFATMLLPRVRPMRRRHDQCA